MKPTNATPLNYLALLTIMACTLAGTSGTAAAQGAITNGADHVATIAVPGGVDTWTFTGNVGDTVLFSIARVSGDANFWPRATVRNPSNVILGAADSGTTAGQLQLTLAATGTFTVQVQSNQAGAPNAVGTYVLRMARAPGAFTVPGGDEGGAITNGDDQHGLLTLGDIDMWSFQANIGESYLLSVVDADNDPNTDFRVEMRIFDPNGVYLGTNAGVIASQLQLTAAKTGTFLVTVAAQSTIPAGTGHYTLRMAKNPGAFVVPAGDEGGTLVNGENHAGYLPPGDIDLWSFQANVGDTFLLSLVDSDNDPNVDFRAEMRIFDPNGVYLGTNAGVIASQLQMTAAKTGTYLVTVAAQSTLPNGVGHYIVRLAKTPGTFTVPSGDEGGAMTNGENHAGYLPPGDIDLWSFTANVGDTFLLSLVDTDADPNVDFRPEMRVFDPFGTYLGTNAGTGASQLQMTAAKAGTFHITVAAQSTLPNGVGHYIIRIAKSPGTFVVPTNDEGGAMIIGANHTGLLGPGDIDMYSFQASIGQSFLLSLVDTDADPNVDFRPEMRVFDPFGTYLGTNAGPGASQLQMTAAKTGTYIVTVAAQSTLPNGVGHYTLRLAEIPGAFVVPSGDEGGTATNGANHTGFLGPGDIDGYYFTANVGESFLLSLADTDNDPNVDFRAEMRVFDPNGEYLGTNAGVIASQLQLTAATSGTYLVTVAAQSTLPNGVGHYVFRLAKSPAAFIIPAGDDGGALRNGEAVGGAITIGDIDMWSFVAAKNAQVSITLANPQNGSTLRPQARIFGPTGTYLGELAVNPTGSTTLTIPASGRYTITVASIATLPNDTGVYTMTVTGILNDIRGTTTTLTAQPSAPGQGTASTLTATVTDIDINTRSNPAGQVAFTSALPADQFTPATCTLAAMPATTDQSSCQVTVTPALFGARTLTATYGGSGIHLGSSGTTTLNVGKAATTTTVTIPSVPFRDNPQTITVGIHIDSPTPVNEGTLTVNVRNGATPVADPASAPVVNSAATVNYILPGGLPAGTYTVVADYSGGPNFSASSASGTLTIVEQTTYSLAEGATGSFFHTNLLLANPNATAAPLRIDFLKEDGSTVTLTPTLLPTSRLTIDVGTVPGMTSTAFSTVVTSIAKVPLLVERTMFWDGTAYGAASEKANEGVASTWYFAEGSQGYFHTFFLLLNPQPTSNVAHVTYVFEDATSLQRDYVLGPTSRFTVDAAADPALLNRSFGATVVFDQPGMAERAMYFGSNPLFSGGTAAAGVTAPATTWQLAEGATGSFFNTFVLIANPNDSAATTNVTYLLDNGSSVTKQHVISGHQRLTINVALEDPSLESAAFGTLVQADRPVVVERSMYWPVPNWYEAHSSMAIFAPGTKWGLAEGLVGGPGNAQTYILVANPNQQAAELTVTFLRTDGTTIVKNFTVGATSRFNIAVTPGGGLVPELSNESFGTVIQSTQPVLVERSVYSDANGVTWAAGTNATGTRLP